MIEVTTPNDLIGIFESILN